MLTRLQVINDMVKSVGQRPFTTESTAHPMYQSANTTLQLVENAVAGHRWWYNTETREIQPDSSGHITVPANVIRADATGAEPKLQLRRNRMHDPSTGTWYITTHALEMTLVFMREWEDLPHEARQYIRARAKYEFYVDHDGQETKAKRYEAERIVAYRALNTVHINTSQTHPKDNPYSAAARLQYRRQTGH